LRATRFIEGFLETLVVPEGSVVLSLVSAWRELWECDGFILSPTTLRNTSRSYVASGTTFEALPLEEVRPCLLPTSPCTAAVPTTALLIEARRSPPVAVSRTAPDSTPPGNRSPSFRERSLRGLSESKADPLGEVECHGW